MYDWTLSHKTLSGSILEREIEFYSPQVTSIMILKVKFAVFYLKVSHMSVNVSWAEKIVDTIEDKVIRHEFCFLM